MTYASGGLIEAVDYNNLVSSGAAIGNQWGTGSGHHGLGQSTSPMAPVAVLATVTAAQWVGLISTINSCLAHEGQPAISPANVISGDIITYYASIATGTATAFNNSGSTGIALLAGTTNTTSYSSAWGSTGTRALEFTQSVTFSSGDAARYFFNAGGKISLTFSRVGGSATTRNTEWSALATACGTINIGYKNTTKTGGSATTDVLLNSDNGGYWSGTSDYVRHFLQYDGAALYQSNNIEMKYYWSGTPSNGGYPVLNIKTIWTNVTTNTYQDTVDGTTSVSLVVNSPATTYLTNTWDTPTFSGSISGTSPPPAVMAPSNVVLPTIAGSAQEGQTLTVSDGTWSGLPAPTLTSQQWMRGGSTDIGSGATYVLVGADVGSSITCTITYSNSQGSASATTVPTGTIVSAPLPPVPVPIPAPTNSGGANLPQISGTTQEGYVLTCSRGVWTNSPTSYSYHWYRNGSSISGEIGNQWLLSASDVGSTITCRVTADNGSSNQATSPGVGLISAAPLPTPYNTSAPYITGGTTEGASLTCNVGSWVNATAYWFLWGYRSSPSGPITYGSWTSSYTYSTAGLAGKYIICEVEATNGPESATANTANFGPMTSPVPGAPVNNATPTITGGPLAGSTFTCSAGSWSNGPTSYRYRWVVAGTTVQDVTTSSPTNQYSGGAGGQSIYCSVAASNAGGAAGATASNAITVTSLPANTSPPTIVGSGIMGGTLSLSNSGNTWSGYPTPTLTYQWLTSRNGGGIIAGATGTSYTTQANDKGNWVGLRVYATNSAGQVSTDTPGIGLMRMSPTVLTRPVISGALTIGSTLSITAGTWDGYPTPLLSYTWYVDHGAGAVQVGTGGSYTIQPADALGWITCWEVGSNSVAPSGIGNQALTGGGHIAGIPHGSGEWGAPGTYSVAVPAGVTSITVTIVGGGGGGGWGSSGNGGLPVGGGGGGGGAGQSDSRTLAVSPGDIVAGIVGPGGAAGYSPGAVYAAAGGAGGPSTLLVNNVARIAVFGGSGGGGGDYYTPNGAGGAGYPAGSAGSLDYAAYYDGEGGYHQIGSGYGTGGAGGSSSLGAGGAGGGVWNAGGAGGIGAGGGGGGSSGWNPNDVESGAGAGGCGIIRISW